MKQYLLLAAVLASSCATPQQPTPPVPDAHCRQPERVLGVEGLEWLPQDDEQVRISMRRCKEKFGDKSCLRTLVKWGTLRYTATCTNGGQE